MKIRKSKTMIIKHQIPRTFALTLSAQASGNPKPITQRKGLRFAFPFLAVGKIATGEFQFDGGANLVRLEFLARRPLSEAGSPMHWDS